MRGRVQNPRSLESPRSAGGPKPSGNRQGKPGRDLAVMDGDLAAFSSFPTPERTDDVAVVRADDHDVVGIMRHGRAERPALEFEPAHEADANVASRVMPPTTTS